MRHMIQSSLPTPARILLSRHSPMNRLLFLLTLCVLTAQSASIRAQTVTTQTEDDYYKLISVSTSQAQTDSRSRTWKPAPDGLALEVSGIAVLDDHRVAVAIHKGEVWILDGVYGDPPSNVTYQRFASALHEPLGLLCHNDSLYTVQRTELTQLRDTDGDDIADEYLTVAKGWGVTGHYHEYAYGPKLDRDGNLWLTLNIGLGLKGDELQRTIHEPAPSAAKPQIRSPNFEIRKNYGRKDARKLRGC